MKTKSLLECALSARKLRTFNISNQIEKSNAFGKQLNLFVDDGEVKNLYKDTGTIDIADPSPILSGVLLSIKDNFMVSNCKATAASKMLLNLKAPFDAAVVEKIKSSNGIIANKSNLDEFGMGSSTHNSLFLDSGNPWQIGVQENEVKSFLTAGGSSGGSAAAVASNTVAASIGSDTGGSVRQPASFCGIVGVKPTYGRVSRHGLISYASSFDAPGVLTRSVLDAAVVLDVISGADGRDPMSNRYGSQYNSVTCSLINESVNLSSVNSAEIENMVLKCKTEVSLSGKRIGIPNELIVNEIDSEVRKQWIECIRILEEAGAEVVSVSLPSLKHAIAMYYVLVCAEASSNLSRYDGIRYGYRMNSDLVSGSSSGIDAVSNTSQKFRRVVSSNRGEGFGSEVIKRIISGSFVLSRDAYDDFFGKATLLRRQLQTEFEHVLNPAGAVRGGAVDALLCPTSPVLPYFLDKSTIPSSADMLVNDLMTVPANLAGVPAVSVPVGITYVDTPSVVNAKQPKQPVPIGMQLMSSWNNEGEMMKIALAIEQRVEFEKKYIKCYTQFYRGLLNFVGENMEKGNSVSLSVIVHPLVLLSVVDHYQRVAKDTKKRVVGVLLGSRKGKVVDVTNSFAVPFEEDLNNPSVWFLDHSFLEAMYRMFRKVNNGEEIVGVYSSGPKIKENDLQITELFKRFSEHKPVFVVIDVRPNITGLPTAAYEVVEEITADGKEMQKIFKHLHCSIEAEEAEGVGVEHLIRDINDPSTSVLALKIQQKVSSLSSLISKLAEIRTYLENVIDGKLPLNQQILSNIQNIMNLLPNLNVEELAKAMIVRSNDLYLVMYISSMIRSVLALHNLLNNKVKYRDLDEALDRNLGISGTAEVVK